jgi:arginase
MAKRHVALIGVPQYLGAGQRGVELGPSALRIAGIGSQLEALGYEVEDTGDIAVMLPARHAPNRQCPKYLHEIRVTCERLRDAVAHALKRGAFPLVLGGDHSIAIGTVAGLSNHYGTRDDNIGLVWFDAHGDVNTPETSPSGNIHGMPLAVALGMGPDELVELGTMQPMLDGRRTSLVGVRDMDRGEQRNLHRAQVGLFAMRDIEARGMCAVMADAIARALSETQSIHVSIDLDAMDPEIAPGVSTPSPAGISWRDAHLAMEMLAATGKVISAELVELNPILDNKNRTAELGVSLLTSLLAG